MPPDQPDKIVVTCACGKKLHAPASAVGRKARCPKCGNVMTLVAPAAKVSAPKVVPPPPPPVEDDPFSAMYDLAQESEQAAQHAPDAPRCPKCFSEMTAGAVLCTSCGFDVRAGKVRQAASAVDAPKKGWFGSKKKTAANKPVDMMAPQGSFMLGLVGSSVGALIGGVIWFFIAWGTGYELGFIALAVGALAGIGMQLGQKGYSTLGGVSAALITFVAILLAKVAVIVAVLMPIMRNGHSFADGDSDYDEEVVQQLVDEDLKQRGVDPEDADDEQVDAATARAEKKIKKMSGEEVAAIKKRAADHQAREELVMYVHQDVMKEMKLDFKNYDEAKFTAAQKEAERRVDAIPASQRDSELKRLRDKSEAELQEKIAAAKAERDADSSSSGSGNGGSSSGSAAVKTGAFLLILLLIVGWKSILFLVLAVGMAYKTAAGAVNG